MASGGGHMHNLTTLIKRLEAATSRLEDMAAPLEGTPQPGANATTVSKSPPEPPKQAAAAPAPPPPPPVAEPLPQSIEDFDKIIDEDVQKFVDLGQKVGGLVAEQSKDLLKAFKAERTYLLVSTKAKKPEPQPPELITELHRSSDAINSIRDANRPSPLFNHLSAVAEGIVAMGWFFESKPVDFVKEMLGSAQFYGNRVLKEYKEKDNTHVEYIQAYYRIFHKLIEYLQEHYPRGLTWNKDGIDAMTALKQIQSGPQSVNGASAPPPPPPLPSFDVGGGPPPPPPPPPGALAGDKPAASGGNDMSAVFEQLNQGTAVTSNLRKVDKTEMTHKNPNLRASSTVPERSDSQTSVNSTNSRSKSPMPSKKPKPESMRVKKPPRKELDGNKWYIEHFDNTSEVIDIPAQLMHSIMISRCNKAIIRVSNKANAISIDNCNNLSIIVDSLVSSIDVIKSPKFALQIDGVVPTVMLDQIDGGMIYLSQQSLDTDILTSKCSGMNIILPPKEGTDEDDKECPLPEQFKSYVKDGALVHEIVEHAG